MKVDEIVITTEEQRNCQHEKVFEDRVIDDSKTRWICKNCGMIGIDDLIDRYLNHRFSNVL